MARYAINGGKVNEEGHGKPWLAFFRTGYIKGLNATQRSAGANMSVDVNLDSTLNFAAAQISTSANINYFGWIDAVENVSVTAAHATLPRLDRLVAYIDLALITSATTNNLNALKFMVVAGTAASSPVVPTSSTIQTAIGASNPYIVLADVAVAAATTTIITANITDARTPAALNMPYIRGGSSNTNGHLVPNVADDTVALLAAVQNFTNKNSISSQASSHLALSAGTSKLVKSTVLRQDNTTNTYQAGNTVTLTGWGVIVPGATFIASEIVSFGVTFLQPPIVTVTFGGDHASATTYGSGGNNIKQAAASAKSITTTNFAAYVHSTDTSSWAAGNTVFYQWMAIGEI